MKIRETITRTGLRIITVRVPYVKKIYLGFTARIGSANDPKGKEGLFHFFEHMAFRGTTNRTMKDIQTWCRRYFLLNNASTGPLNTTYYGIGVLHKLPEMCAFLSDVYWHSSFPPPAFVKERKTIANEIAGQKHNDLYITSSALRECLYRSNPMRRPGCGTEKSIKTIARKDLIATKTQWYTPSNTVVVAAGDIDHKKVVHEVLRHAPSLKRTVAYPSWDDEYNALPNASTRFIPRQGSKFAKVIMGCKMPRQYPDKWSIAFSTLAEVLFDSNGSRIWNAVREQKGLVYVLDQGRSGTYGIARYWYIYFETKPEHVNEVKQIIWRELVKPIGKRDRAIFKEVKNKWYDLYSVGLEGNVGGWNGMVLDKIIDNESPLRLQTQFQREQRISKSLTLKDIENVRRELMRPERFATVVLGPPNTPRLRFF